nr:MULTISPECIES: hypothetical protein [Achromobacter]
MDCRRRHRHRRRDRRREFGRGGGVRRHQGRAAEHPGGGQPRARGPVPRRA